MKLNIILIFALGLYCQDINSQPDLNMFKGITPVWIHGTFDTTALDIIPYNGYTELEHVKDIIDDTSIYSSYNYTLLEDASDGGFIEKININTGKTIWDRVYDLRTIDNTEHQDDMVINKDGDIEIMGGRQIRKYIKGDTTANILKFCTQRYRATDGQFLGLTYPAPDDTTAPRVYFYEYFYYIDRNTYQFIRPPYLLPEDDFIKTYVLNEKGQAISSDTVHINSGFHFNEIEDMKLVNTDTFVALMFSCNTFIKWSDTFRFKHFVKIYDRDLNEIKTFDISDDLSKDRHLSIYLTYADSKNIVFRYTYPGTDDWEYRYLIYDYDGNLVDSINLNKYKIVDGRITRISEDEFLVGGIEKYNDGGDNPIYFYKKKIGNELKFLRKIEMRKLDYCLAYWNNLIILPNNDIILSAYYWKIAYSAPATWLKFPVKIRFSSKDIDITSASEEISSNEKLNIFPNPSADQITLSCENFSHGSIEIMDRLGRKVSCEKISVCEELNIDISRYTPGLYFVRLIDDSGKVTGRGKFVKE